MFDKNSFTEALKSARKVDEILGKSSHMKMLASLSATFSANMGNATKKIAAWNNATNQSVKNITALATAFAQSDDQAARIAIRADKIKQDIEQQAMTQAHITRKVYERIKFYDEELDQVKQLETELKKQLEIETNISNKSKDKVTREKAFLRTMPLRDELKTLSQRKAALTKLKEVEQASAKKLGLVNLIDTAFNGLASKFLKILGLMGTALAPFLIIAAIFKAILGSYREALRATVEVGLDASQRGRQIAKATSVVAQAAKEFSLLSLEDVVRSADALSSRLGTVEISNTLIKASAQLSRSLNVSAEDAATVLEYFTRLGKQVPEAAEYSTTLIKATALQNEFNAGLAIRDFAANTANFAKSAKTGAVEMTKAVIQARQLGVALSTISGIADNIVSNFEGALEAQATIGAFAPGFDMSGLLVASQFGTDEDIGRELQSAVQSMGMEFDQLPRSFKLAISSSLGVSVQELGNLMKGEGATAMSPGEQALAEAQKNALNEAQRALLNPLQSMDRGITGIFSLLVQKWFGGNTPTRVSAINELQQLKSNPIESPEYSAALQAAYDRVRNIDQNADILKDMKKQQEMFNKTWMDFMTVQANKPITVVTQIEGREIARAMTSPGVSRSSGQF